MKWYSLAILLSLAYGSLGQQKCGTTPVAPNLSIGTWMVNNTNLHNDIVGGAVATAYSWPWQVVWCYMSGSTCSLMCGGSVIGTNWVMTAGHCVEGYTNQPSTFRVKSGVFTQTSSNEVGEMVSRVKRIVLHPQYSDKNNPINDIALIELQDPVTFSNHIQPVCLPSSDTVAVEPNLAWATGWGTTSSGGSVSSTLRQVQVPFVSQTTCSRAYSNSITSVMVCAGKQGKDSCQGDSGGPLVVKNKNGYWFQYGITSWGYGCAAAGYPGVYGRTSSFCSFIQSTTGISCNNPDTYS
jgi:transmembrane serine protease 2